VKLGDIGEDKLPAGASVARAFTAESGLDSSVNDFCVSSDESRELGVMTR
jgi:hypothetical protein